MPYVLNVSEVNKYVKELVSKDLILSGLWVRGEISNYKHHYSGHMYFTIKDEGSLLRCVMFRTHNSSLKFSPENGMRVVIKGYISIYERDGQYQLYAEEMQPDGLGALHVAFEQLKHKLENEGLFDEIHKKRLPILPKAIGVVTSLTGSVIKDIINVLSRRFNNVDVKIYPVAVQGEFAPLQISRAIERLNETKCVDIIILARGGGSLEELWAFNDEIVARRIFESDIPVISAVGHETDFTIADFVADLRAPTPSAAAELVMPEKTTLQQRIADMTMRLKNSIIKNLDMNKMKLERLKNSVPLRQPFDMVNEQRLRLDSLTKYMVKAMTAKKLAERSKFNYLLAKLDGASPLNIMSKGYSVIKLKKENHIVKSIKDVKLGTELEITLSDGKIISNVTGILGGRSV
jgi:exodeoxyribonuclease VII large subunit